MGSQAFLFVDQQPIALETVLRYLQSTGRLDTFIGEILRQYVIEQELRSRSDITVSSAKVEQMTTDFRLQNQLLTPEEFDAWLSDQGMDYDTFRQQLEFNLRLEELKTEISHSRLQEHFIERKLFLDQIILSRIVVTDRDLAEELHQQIIEGARFEPLAQEYSIADDRIFNGMMGLVSRGSIPDVVRAAIDLANPGDVLQPIHFDQTWTIFRLEQVLPATLDDPQIQQTLREELLDQWLGEKLQRMAIEVRVEDE